MHEWHKEREKSWHNVKRKTKCNRDMDTHQLSKSEHSFTVRTTWPYLSPSHWETYVCAAVAGWCTPRQPLLPFDIHQRLRREAYPTSLTFIGPSDSTVHRTVITYTGLTTQSAGSWEGAGHLSHRCIAVSPMYIWIYKQLPFRHFVKWTVLLHFYNPVPQY